MEILGTLIYAARTNYNYMLWVLREAQKLDLPPNTQFIRNVEKTLAYTRKMVVQAVSLKLKQALSPRAFHVIFIQNGFAVTGSCVHVSLSSVTCRNESTMLTLPVLSTEWVITFKLDFLTILIITILFTCDYDYLCMYYIFFMQERKGERDSYFLSPLLQQSKVRFVHHYEKWLQETGVDVPPHPWDAFQSTLGDTGRQKATRTV